MRRRWLSLILLLLLVALLGEAWAVTVTLREANNTLIAAGCNPCAYAVYAGQNLSQSFTAAGNYTLSKVALYVANVGVADTLNVSLVADAGGIPSSSPGAVLSRGSNNTPATYGWYFFDLAPHVRLTSGTTYWIVTRNGAPSLANGYGWWRSGADSYAGGTLAYDQGKGWARVNEDMPFRNYGYNDAQIRVALGANRTLARIGDAVRYTVYMNNTGTELASRAWVNLTLPPEVTYTSDTAGTLGGVRTGNYNWTFINVTAGAHSFTVDGIVGSGVGGQAVVATAQLDFHGVLASVGQGSAAQRAITVQGPGITLAAVGSPPYVRRGDNVNFTIYYNNTGNDLARWLWINITLPTTANYLSDTASASRSAGPGRLNLTFANVSAGPHSFTLTLTQKPNLSGGTPFPLNSRADYRDVRGNSYPRNQAVATVILRGPRITLALSADRAFLTPGDFLALRIDYGNTGSGITLAENLYINLTLVPGLGLRNVSAGASYNTTTRNVTWLFPTLLTGVTGSLRANATSSPLLGDGQALVIVVRATFADDLGNAMAPVSTNLALGVRTPVLALQTTLAQARVEALQATEYRVYINNTGAGICGRAWVNVTLSSALAFTGFNLQGTSGLLVNFQPGIGRLGFVFVNLAPGRHALVITLTPMGALANGTALSISSTVDYRDANGNPRPPQASPPVTLLVKAPLVQVVLQASRTSAQVGDTVALTAVVTNRGLATASDVWVNLTLHPSLIRGSSSFPWDGGRPAWHLRSLQPGAAVVINFTVAIAGNATQGNVLDITAATDYTDSHGGLLARDRGSPLGLVIPNQASPISPLTLGLLAALGAAGAFLAYLFVSGRKEPEVEEVLLIHREGLLLAQASRERTHGKDRDILAGSLVAIQAFIKDAFQTETEKDLERMDLGEYKILIRRGNYAFLVVAVKGSPTRRTGARLQAALGKLESEHADVLAGWMGNMDEMTAVQRTLEEVLHGHLGPHPPGHEGSAHEVGLPPGPPPPP